MNAASLSSRIRFVYALAVEVRRCRGPRDAEAKQFVKLCRLWKSLVEQAEGADGQLAEGLAAAVLRNIEAAAERFRAGALA